MTIDTVADPLQPRIRVLSPQERALLRQQLDVWLAKGYVETSQAWVVCNPLWVDKADGTKRTCINYKPINAVTSEWEWPLPKIREIRYHIRDGVWFFRLDLKEAFHRITILTRDRPLTAFATPWGAYQFTRMPFGLTTAPATYQRFLDWVLHGIDHIINYVDDILGWGKTRREVAALERRVRTRLRECEVEVNEKKSETATREITFVGLRITPGRVGCALKMREWATPTTKPGWQSLLGFVNCFRDFLPNLSDMTAGLYPGTTQLPTKERAAKCAVLLATIEQHVSLSHYRDNEESHLYLDASQYAVGAVLLQKGHVCAIYSKGLSQAQTRYSATDREHVALMLGLEAFRVMCQGNSKITTHTDHSALLNRNEERLTARQQRWKTRIVEITSNIVHVKGVDNLLRKLTRAKACSQVWHPVRSVQC